MVRVRPRAILRFSAKSELLRPGYTSSCAPNPRDGVDTTQSQTLCVPSGASVSEPSATVPPNAAWSSWLLSSVHAPGMAAAAAPDAELARARGRQP
jgi:hypothetical protein